MVVKLITHSVVFLAGAGAGIYWGVHNPTAAANLSDVGSAKIQQAVAQAKKDVLSEVAADQNSAGSSISDSHKAKVQQMLQSAQQDLNAAKAKVSGQ
jgi:uncharacterized membrane protein